LRIIVSAEADGWPVLGATHVAVNTEFASGTHRPSEANSVDEHLRLLERYRDVIDGFGTGGG